MRRVSCFFFLFGFSERNKRLERCDAKTEFEAQGLQQAGKRVEESVVSSLDADGRRNAFRTLSLVWNATLERAWSR